MIVITGPGRSGTSLIARAYEAAGLPVGGVWDDRIHAGLEDPAVVNLNRRICSEMEISLLGQRRGAPNVDDLMLPARLKAMKALLAPKFRAEAKRRFEMLPWNRSNRFTGPQWRRLPELADQLADEIGRLSTARRVVKDPLFCSTLPVWLAANAEISHVVVTARSVDEMLTSRASAGHLAYKSEGEARTSLIFALGNLLTTLWDHRLPYTLLRFPDFLADPRDAAYRLPVPDERYREPIVREFVNLADPSLIHSTQTSIKPLGGPEQ